jgi:hypothetical protein
MGFSLAIMIVNSIGVQGKDNVMSILLEEL